MQLIARHAAVVTEKGTHHIYLPILPTLAYTVTIPRPSHNLLVLTMVLTSMQSSGTAPLIKKTLRSTHPSTRTNFLGSTYHSPTLLPWVGLFLWIPLVLRLRRLRVEHHRKKRADKSLYTNLCMFAYKNAPLSRKAHAFVID